MSGIHAKLHQTVVFYIAFFYCQNLFDSEFCVNMRSVVNSFLFQKRVRQLKICKKNLQFRMEIDMKNTVTTFQQAKEKGEKLTMLTAYDYSMAKLIDEAGINSILVGDSLGNVMLGYEDTLSVTMEDMIHHGAAVARGAKNALVIIDMPFMSYQTSTYDALLNAGRLMKEGRANAVKLEGGTEVCPQIKAIVEAGIPVRPYRPDAAVHQCVWGI